MYEIDLGLMLERDLKRAHLKQKELVALLNEGQETPISEQAISNWKRSGRIPRQRVERLIEIFGPDSEVARNAEALSSQRFVPRVAAFTQVLRDPFADQEPARLVAPTGRPELTRPALRESPQAIDRLREMRDRFEMYYQGVHDSLPYELRPNLLREYKAGPSTLRGVYRSDKLMVLFTPSPISNMTYPRLVKLLVARACDPGLQSVRFLCICGMPPPAYSPLPFQIINAITAEAAALGIQLSMSSGPDAVAQVIADYEAGKADRYDPQPEEYDF